MERNTIYIVTLKPGKNYWTKAEQTG